MGGMARRRPTARNHGVIVVIAVAVVGGVFALLPACGTNPVGVDACKKIEETRCESAQACGIGLENPAHTGDTPAENVAACERYYDDACLHGLATTVPPRPQDVDACVQAIITGSCDVVREPQTSPACAFLLPPVAVVADAAAVDADATTD
jgi:hypothetical protein